MAASKNPRLRLLHMRDEIESLSNELAGLCFETYRESYGLRRITERAIQIVSEAARALPEELRARYPEAPWADIIAIGNPLRHEYHRIDDKVLWETATVDLPKLRPIIQRMIAEYES
jgi:uncharacterized protein with HEPN domain